MTTVPIICIFWVFWKTAWYFMVIFRYNTIIHITSWWHVSLLAPLPLDLCYYQFISLCLENAGYIYLSLELHMHTTMLRNCVSLYLWRHIFEDISLRKEIQGLFSFKIKVYFFWIAQRFLKNSNKSDWKKSLRDFLLFALFIYTTSSTNFEKEFLHWLIGLLNKG